MIVPSNKLLIWVALSLPLIAVASVVPSTALVACVPPLGLILVALVDAAMSHMVLRGIRVRLPDMVRMSKGREGSIPLRIENASGKDGNLSLGLPFPPELRSDYHQMRIVLQGGHHEYSVVWPCSSDFRGSYRIDRCYFQAPSLCGLWEVRGFSMSALEIRVYPDLARERRALASIFLNRGSFGLHTQRVLGQGRDFEKLRDYIPGDSFDDIHWKATAKRGRPVTKLFQVERTQEVYVVVDYSRLSGRLFDGEQAIEQFISASLALGLVAERQGDLFGVIAFSDKVSRFVRASGGKASYSACREALYRLNVQTASPDYGELFSTIKLRLRRRALLLMLTDLSDPVLAESFLDGVSLISGQHVVMVAMLNRPGASRIFSEPIEGTADELYARLGGHMAWHSLYELRRNLQRNGVKLSLVDNAMLAPEIVSQYMNIKARQML